MSLIEAYRSFLFFASSRTRGKVEAVCDLGSGRLIVDRHKQLGDFANKNVELPTSIDKEAEARKIIFDTSTPSGTFFEAGGRDGDLTYLLGIKNNLEFDQETYRQNRERFDKKFHYIGNDLNPNPGKDILQGDLCSETFLDSSQFSEGFAAVAYSNNVFEHLKRPWIAAENLYRLLKPGGVCVTIAPFSVRYHEAPGDYFRYTHTGLSSLFEAAGPIETIASGYDILGRRNNWQGQGSAKDIVPVDAFGAWRETWFAFHAFRKPVLNEDAGRNV